MPLTNKQKQDIFIKRMKSQKMKLMRGVYVPIKHEKALKAELRAKVKVLMGDQK